MLFTDNTTPEAARSILILYRSSLSFAAISCDVVTLPEYSMVSVQTKAAGEGDIMARTAGGITCAVFRQTHSGKASIVRGG